MKCERVLELLTQSASEGAAQERRLAAEHAAGCADCRGAVAAVHALRMVSLEPAPDPRPGAFERAMAAATRRRLGAGGQRLRPFWAGMGLGAAVAAGIAAAAVLLLPGPAPEEPVATPRLTMSLHEQRDVSISLTAPEAMMGAEIYVVLSGPVGLGGYEGQRELRWRTDLEPGVNRLTLPVEATAEGDGQVLVEVVHDGRRRTFLIDVRARS